MNNNTGHTAHNRSALKNIVQFASSNFYRHILGLATAFFRPGLLGPELFGIWSLLNVIPFYANFAHLGTRSAMRFKISELEHRQAEQINAYKHTTLLVTLAVTAILVIAIVCYAITAPVVKELEYGLYAIAFIIIFNALYEHFGAEAKGHHNFSLVSQVTVIRYTLNFILCVAFIWLWGLYGALLALALSCFLSLCFLLRKSSVVFPTDASMNLAKYLVKDGAPIMALDIVNLTLRNLDKILVATYLGAKSLGIYAIAGILVGVMINIPGSSREVTEQLLMSESKNKSAATLLNEYLIKSIRLNAYLMPLVIAVMCYALPIFIQWFLPAFSDSIEPAQWLLIGAFFLTLSYPSRGIIVFNQWQKQAAFIASFSVVFSALVISYTLQHSTKLTDVTLAASSSFVLLFISLTSFVYIKYKVVLRHFFKECIQLLCPFLILIVSYLLSRYVAIYSLPVLVENLINGALFLVLYVPVLLWAIKTKQISIPAKIIKKLKLNKVIN